MGKRFAYGIFIGIWVVLSLNACRSAASSEGVGSDLRSFPVHQTGLIANPVLIEASGMVHSHHEADLLWMVNDGGHPAVLFAVQSNGRDHGMVAVEGADNTDWEDLAGFKWHGRPFILIADVGDNQAVRDTSRIYVVAEPVRQATGVFPATAAVEWQFRFRYEDGPRDCEGVAVDTREGRILLLTKRTQPPQLYALPLRPAKMDAIVVARRIGDVPRIPPPTTRDLIANPRFGPIQSQPTALDFRSDNRLAVVLTYKEAYLFLRDRDESWTSALSGQPVTVPFPRLKQQETACFSPDGHKLHISTEQQHAPMLKINLHDRP